MTKQKHNQIKQQKTNRNVSSAIVHILASFNNTIVTISDLSGNVIAWSSAGANGFKGSKKATPFAAQVTADAVIKNAQKFGVKVVSVYVKGVGSARESAIRAIAIAGVNISFIKDITPIPHNGCRPPKRRRV